jgi:hypothetical protein
MIRLLAQCLLLSFLFFSCSKMANEQNNTDENVWKPILLKEWESTPVLNDRIANEDDVKKEFAVFYIEWAEGTHKPYKIKLPKLAYLTDNETKQRQLVVIIQIEELSDKVVVGYRNLDGKNGAALLNEFEILDKAESEILVGKELH